jgi:NAD(P)H-hydrate epimerase
VTTLPTLPLPRLEPRAADSHKGDYGRALLIGGSRGMSGAIALAGMAALRGGAGLVTVAVPDRCCDTVAGFEPSYMTIPLPCDDRGRIGREANQVLRDPLDQCTCFACGPGLGRSDQLTELVAWTYGNVSQPAVFDADALNALSNTHNPLASPGGPRVVTPHPGEFRRLIGEQTKPMSTQELRTRAIRLAEQHDIVIVLKGNRTLVTDGKRVTYNSTGNPGMATGGSGDVLTGLIAALICQGLPVFESAQLGAHIHGLAGDLAAEPLGQVSLIASDLVRYLPMAFQGVS